MTVNEKILEPERAGTISHTVDNSLLFTDIRGRYVRVAKYRGLPVFLIINSYF